jgi:hypothetical protein
MNPEEETAILLSGAATDLEQVAEVRDDLGSEERQELAELVSRVKDLNERLSYESSLRDLRSRSWAAEEVEDVLNDSRYHYDSAQVEVNGPLALIQAGMRTRVDYLSVLLGVETPGQGELDYPEEEWSGFGDAQDDEQTEDA